MHKQPPPLPFQKPLPILFILILISSSVLVAWQYSENARLTTENVALRNQHASDQTTIAQLGQNITRLQEELKIKVGLTFLWSDKLNASRIHIQEMIACVNKEWNAVGIGFIIVDMRPCDWLPVDARIDTSWISRANTLHSGSIPVGIFRNMNLLVGGAVLSAVELDGAFSVLLNENAYVRGFVYSWDAARAGRLLAHELLHVFGVTDEEIHAQMPNLAYDFTRLEGTPSCCG